MNIYFSLYEKEIETKKRCVKEGMCRGGRNSLSLAGNGLGGWGVKKEEGGRKETRMSDEGRKKRTQYNGGDGREGSKCMRERRGVKVEGTVRKKASKDWMKKAGGSEGGEKREGKEGTWRHNNSMGRGRGGGAQKRELREVWGRKEVKGGLVGGRGV